ncbi:hypothetical protein [Kribbella kalugense]|uniref:DUF8175 domain-containing protein n=1 Tax=Kribbella kalugense TaxID=2512221 RepID=A0A4R7ZKG8_9ACTN|nr:hypothetical protein [Kribbella kalugense]TDW18283.1 hypothetical protein EV650_4867 [Kribbella kalugense]
MSNDTEEKSPYGAGFIAACIVVGAVLLCGLLILVTGSGSSGSATASAQQPPDPAPVARAENDPATPVSTVDRAQAGGCGLPAGDQAVPDRAPSVDSWEVSRRIVVPRSSAYGPRTTDTDGFRHCFAHSPTGALYAAYSAIAAIADQSKVVPTARKLMIPGAATDSLIQELTIQQTSTESSSIQPVGYRVVDAGPERVTVMLAFPVESVYMSATLTLVWYQGDWRIQPPAPGQAVGAPFAQHRDLADFVNWSGV